MTVRNLRGWFSLLTLGFVFVVVSCSSPIQNGNNSGGGGGSGTDAYGSPCSLEEVGMTRTCCGSGTQTCVGAEISEWGPCQDASGQTLMCPGECVPGESSPGCGGAGPMCESNGTPPDGVYGTQYECYGFSNVDNTMYQLDRDKTVVTPICQAPAALGPIEAFAINPLTGNSYIVAQDTSDFGKFIPRSGTALCVYSAMGKFPSASIGGFGFDNNGVLYAGEENTGQVWRFTQNPVTKEPTAQYTLLGSFPNGSEGLAFHPMTGLAYNSDGSTLHIVDINNLGTSLFSCDLGGGHETLFFDKDGSLYSTNNATEQFVRITIDRQAGTCSTTNLFPIAPATQLEGSDCNTGGTCDTCHCIL